MEHEYEMNLPHQGIGLIEELKDFNHVDHPEYQEWHCENN